jgi:hypothetical protein
LFLMRLPFYRRRHNRAAPQATPEINLLDPNLWDDVSDNSLREMQRQAEMMLSATVTVALGTDSRIATTMSVLGAAGIAVLVAAASLIGNKSPDWLLICAPLICAISLLVAAMICASAIAPTLFLLPGASPQNIFSADTADGGGLRNDEGRLRTALICSAQRAISHNMNRAIISTARFRLAFFIAIAGLLSGSGFIIFWVASRVPGFF